MIQFVVDKKYTMSNAKTTIPYICRYVGLWYVVLERDMCTQTPFAFTLDKKNAEYWKEYKEPVVHTCNVVWLKKNGKLFPILDTKDNNLAAFHAKSGYEIVATQPNQYFER